MAKNFHDPQVVASYDQHIVKLIPGYVLIHQQIAAILRHYLPESARVLVVGCGTGYELTYLSQQHPDWQLTALDLSAAMLETAQQRLAGVNQIEWVEGDLDCLDSTMQYDAVLSILVAHFIEPSEKLGFFQSICRHLKPTGLLLSVDLTQPEQESDLTILQQVCEQTGLTPEQSQKMRQRLQQDFHLFSREQNIQLLHRAGFARVTSFWQMLQYHGVMAFPV
ncbi:class I SAM-dependent methyltransferase [Acinetobacter sp. ANC 4641]|uniref:class I SAM-dependent methyltransferase n=1 Tax=Acinetobacter sp. ANC 4641 TaxID=2529847 RepID=UPI00103A6B51|nr:class I SAM-dependent methyltransferase [Acinetobacter sp. ANC 4641]TCB12545.1 class I SAM-dependent methyltransferase [Acinetobacter sp. ANC 4641]